MTAFLIIMGVLWLISLWGVFFFGFVMGYKAHAEGRRL